MLLNNTNRPNNTKVPQPTEKKVSYAKIKKAYLKCEVDKLENGSNNNCKAIFKEEGIDLED